MELLSIILLIIIAIMLPLIGTLLEKALKQNDLLKQYLKQKGLYEEWREMKWTTKQEKD